MSERIHDPARRPGHAGGQPAHQPGRPRVEGGLLALQQSAGNEAVASLLRPSSTPAPPPTPPGSGGPAVQRQDPPDRKEASSAADFEFTGGVPVTSGTVSAADAGTSVLVTAPKVDMPFTAQLKDTATLSQGQNIGYIQNLVASNRVGVYRKGGDPAGELVKEQHEARKKRWDAVFDPAAMARNPPQFKKHPGVFAPWYWPPKGISDGNRDGLLVKSDQENDQPVAEFAKEVSNGRFGKGRLVETRGSDSFKLGLVVKGSLGLIRLTASEWSVPWNVTLDAKLSGKGQGVSTKVLADLAQGPDPDLSTWSFEGEGDVFEGFATVEEAMKRTPSELIKWLVAAREHDEIAYDNICQALDAKDPYIDIGVRCEKTDAWVGRDTVNVAVRSGGREHRQFAPMALNTDETEYVQVRFSSLFGSASAITSGTTVEVDLLLGGETATSTQKYPFPGSSGPVALKSGRYVVTILI